ncbi:MAG: DUF1566 domain-containing protein [Magnetococcus sp. DMHC-8]
MTASGTPIIELHGHLVRDIFHGVDRSERMFLQGMASRTDLLSTVQMRLFLLVTAMLRLVLSLYRSVGMVRPLFGCKDEVTLRFYKEHIDVYTDSMRFWVAGQSRQHQQIAWHNTAVRGSRVAFLLFFRRCHLCITHGGGPSRITDLGPMPEEAFRQLVERLKSFASSPVVRQQVASAAPFRFRAEGLQRLALAMFAVLLAVSMACGVVLFGPQLLKWLYPDSQEAAAPVQPPGNAEPPAAQPPKVEEDYAFMTDLEARYRQVLSVDPDNQEARQGLLLLAEQYVGLARKAGEDKLWSKAEGFLTRAEQIEPTLPSIEPAREKIRRARELAEGNRTVAAGGWSPPKVAQQAAPQEKKYSWLVDNGDGTVTDTRSRLIGLKSACFDKDPWERSMTIVVRLADGQCGLSDDSVEGSWRLPTKEELPRLVEWEKSGLFAVVPGRSYWSGTTHFGNESLAWFVDPRNGYVDYGSKTTGRHYVWPVRNEPRSEPE